MYDFEVRILTAERRPSLIMIGPHPSVLLALRTARQLAADGHFVQVWRDHECVHYEHLEARSG
jgi:hypothetical protein